MLPGSLLETSPAILPKVALLLCLRYRRLNGEKGGRGGGRGGAVQWTVELMVLSCSCLPSRKTSAGYNICIFIHILYSSRLAHTACSVYSSLPLIALGVPPTTPSLPSGHLMKTQCRPR